MKDQAMETRTCPSCGGPQPDGIIGGLCLRCFLKQVAASDPLDPSIREGFARLVQSYYHLLYAYTRRKGYSPQESQDIAQAFFAWLLEKNLLATFDPGKGSFRSFLLVAMKSFLADEGQNSRAE
jgi:hypothetical protein